MTRHGYHTHYYVNEQGEYHGEMTVWDKHSQLCKRITFVNGKREGLCIAWDRFNNVLHRAYKNDILHGETNEWHANGQLTLQQTYVNGRLDGDVKEWLADGTLIRHHRYVNFKMLGPQRMWHENGQLAEQYMYVNDLRHGESIELDRKGNVTRRVLYNRGRLVDEGSKRRRV